MLEIFIRPHSWGWDHVRDFYLTSRRDYWIMLALRGVKQKSPADPDVQLSEGDQTKILYSKKFFTGHPLIGRSESQIKKLRNEIG